MLDSAQCVYTHTIIEQVTEGRNTQKIWRIQSKHTSQKQHQNLLAFDEMMLILMQNVNKNWHF